METKTTTTTNLRSGGYGVIKEINTIDGGYRYVVGCWVDLKRDELVLIHIMPPVGEKITFSNPLDAWKVATRFSGKVVLDDVTPVYEWEPVEEVIKP